MKFLLFGTGLGSNYGSDAAIIGTERILHKRFPHSDVWVQHLSWRAPNYGDTLGVLNRTTIKSDGEWIRLLRFCRRICEKSGLLARRVAVVPKPLVKQSDCVLSIGGDLYTFADKEKNWPFPYPIMEAGNEIMRFGKPYVIWCASVGPLEKAGTRLGEMVEHLRACRAIIVREQDSYSYLRDKIGLKSNVYLAADPAFLMEPEPFDFPFIKEQGIDKLLAINFCLGPMQHVYGQLPVEQFQAELVSYVKKLLDELRIRVLLVPHLPGAHMFLTPIYELLKNQYSKRIVILPGRLGSPKTKWAVSQANALLTMRFHCALAGFSTCTPTIVLVSTSKGAKICKEMYGNLKYALDMRNMNPDIVTSKVKDILDNEDSARRNLKPMSDEMKRRALGAGDILAEVLQGGLSGC